ncbi:hypothetical protein RB195_016695 [Necator americanus]|uniref:Uncharacterized protein n=1 Tax=Necator americanus TaxID=51031 RepID=A0ABR1C3Z8_NECAM
MDFCVDRGNVFNFVGRAQEELPGESVFRFEEGAVGEEKNDSTAETQHENRSFTDVLCRRLCILCTKGI